MERHTAFTDLNQLYESILNCLEATSLSNDLNNRFDSHLVTEASGLRKKLRSSSCIVCFQTCKYLYDYTKGLPQQLQGSKVEIAQAYEMVSVVAAQLNDIRVDAASKFQNVFTKCQAMTALADTTITVPRTVSRQNFRDNVEHENAEQYYCRTVVFKEKLKMQSRACTSSQVVLVMLTTKWSISNATIAMTFQMKMG